MVCRAQSSCNQGLQGLVTKYRTPGYVGKAHIARARREESILTFWSTSHRIRLRKCDVCSLGNLLGVFIVRHPKTTALMTVYDTVLFPSALASTSLVWPSPLQAELLVLENSEPNFFSASSALALFCIVSTVSSASQRPISRSLALLTFEGGGALAPRCHGMECLIPLHT